MRYPVLVGDIGGTNARFATIGDVHSMQRNFEAVKLADFSNLEEALQTSVFDKISNWPKSMVLAVATPLVGEEIRLTNAHWTIDPGKLASHFGLSHLELVNDFTAQGLAALALGQDSLERLGTGEIVEDQPKVVIGPGTGLGVAHLIPVEGKWIIVPGEGGHVDLGPRTHREEKIWQHLPHLSGRMPAEEALSGRGFVALYNAICAERGTAPKADTGAAITALAAERKDEVSLQAIEMFISLLGRVAGDAALVTMARGGVYVAGGITRKLLPLADSAVFRAEFDNKEPYSDIMRQIPVMLMMHELPALEGLCAYVRQPERFAIAGSTRRYGGPR